MWLGTSKIQQSAIVHLLKLHLVPKNANDRMVNAGAKGGEK